MNLRVVDRQVELRTAPIRVGDELAVRGGPDRLDVTVRSVAQRNWSRVGAGTTARGTVFLKQFVDRLGRPRPDDLAHERAGLAAAAALRSVETLDLVGADEDRLVLASPWIDLVPVDLLLRQSSTSAFERRWRDTVLPALPTLLDDLSDALPGAGVDAAKPRRWPSSGDVLGLKGLDVRNLAVPAGEAREDRLVLFDPGKPYRAPVEEVAAKLVVSVALLNWGAPVSRFRRGVPRGLLADVVAAVGARTHRQALADEVALQRRIRLEALPTGRGLHGAARRGAVRTLGARYLRDLETAVLDAAA